jgi:hypothetical protein
LTEDEYSRFGNWDAEDELAYGIRAADVQVPSWDDRAWQGFEYLGSY